MKALSDKKKRVFLKNLTIVLSIFSLSVFVSVCILFSVINSSERSRRLEAKKFAYICASNIERIFGQTFLINEAIAEFVQKDEGDSKNFEDFARRLLHEHLIADCVQLAPNGVISQVVPQGENEKLVGFDIFSDKERASEAERSRDLGIALVAGPYSISQNAKVIEARLPLFSDIWKTNFWGFVNVVVRVSKIFEGVDFLTISDKGFLYSVYKTDGRGSSFPIWGVDFNSLKNPIITDISIQNSSWKLALSPDGQWFDGRFVLLVSLLLLLLVFFSTAFSILVLKFLAVPKNNNVLGIDPTTGLYSRELAIFVLSKEIEYAARNDSRVAICRVFIDSKDEKIVSALVEKLLSSVRAEDIISRFGDSEFVVIFRGKNTGTNYQSMLERIRALFKNDDVYVGFSAYPADGKTLEDLLKKADKI